MTESPRAGSDPTLPRLIESDTHASVASGKAQMPTDSPAPVASKIKNGRARVSNSVDRLPGLDGRSPAARRYRDLVAAFVADSGGIEQCSAVRVGLVRRLASVTLQTEMLEARMVNGETVDVSALCQLASTALRLSSRLSIERVLRPVNNEVTLADLMREAAEAAP
jgi:hypothetical protein